MKNTELLDLPRFVSEKGTECKGFEMKLIGCNLNLIS